MLNLAASCCRLLSLPQGISAAGGLKSKDCAFLAIGFVAEFTHGRNSQCYKIRLLGFARWLRLGHQYTVFVESDLGEDASIAVHRTLMVGRLCHSVGLVTIRSCRLATIGIDRPSGTGGLCGAAVGKLNL